MNLLRNFSFILGSLVFAGGLFCQDMAHASSAILHCIDQSDQNAYRLEIDNSGARVMDALGNIDSYIHAEMAPGAQSYVLIGLNHSGEIELPVTAESYFDASWTHAGLESKLACEILQGSLASE